MITTIIGWLIFGLIVGAIARLITPGRDEMGCLATSILGIVGSVLGGWISHELLGRPRPSGYFSRSWIFSIIGGILVLLAWRMISNRRA
jgi:uncharacterized membrane protein YeaQ/YmgE (transglycosylase-associated protein family)